MNLTFHLVYLRSGAVLLTRKPYADWREIQDEWDDYMTSLGPWTAGDVLEFFREDFGDETRGRSPRRPCVRSWRRSGR